MRQKLKPIFTLLILAQSCKTVEFAKYYPITSNKQLVYSFSKDKLERNINYRDTLICRLNNANTFKNAEHTSKGISIFSLNTRTTAREKSIQFFYFEHPPHTEEDSIYIQDRSFARLPYSFYKKRLYMSNDMVSKDSNDLEGFFRMVFPKRIDMNTRYYFKDGDAVQTFSFIGKENLKIRNRLYQDCLVLTCKRNYGLDPGPDTVWFAKDIGIVKWKKTDDLTGILLQ